MTIFQGDIYWIDVGKPHGSEPAYLCPCVVVRNDALDSINNQFETSKSRSVERGKKSYKI
jgi:mRNA-degrading endonuclease toxin of MazEF toxin-antitoxin module